MNINKNRVYKRVIFKDRYKSAYIQNLYKKNLMFSIKVLISKAFCKNQK